MPTADCPECDEPISVADGIELGEHINCDDCGTELEVESLGPLEFVIYEDEDLDDDDDDEDSW